MKALMKLALCIGDTVDGWGAASDLYIYSVFGIVSPAIFNTDAVVLCVLQPGRDVSGAAMALFTARLHHPSQTSHQAVLNALIFQLDVAMERYATLPLFLFSFTCELSSSE